MNILDLKRKLLPLSGPQSGDSGGGAPATQTVIKDLPDWAKGYAKNTIERAAALSDQPYQAYQGNRIAGFSPLQLGAQQGAANMTTSDTTKQIAQRGLNTDTFGQAQASQYMNPYMQNVVDIQKREAGRQSGMQGVAQQAGATQAGGLGGSRDAIMRAERERNLGQQMGDIQAQGSNAAYTNAQAQFNADQARSMQGLNLAGAAAGQQFQQGMDINKLQAGYGAQQQAMRQQGLTQAYQDFLGQKQEPYNQLSYLSNMIQGLPLGGVSQSSSSAGSPSAAQTFGALGAGAYGLSKFMAEGGSVDSQQNIESIVHKLSDQQLAQAEKAAKARGDVEQMQIIAMERATRASMKSGLGSMPVDMEKMMPTQESMARGGIVAFNEGGYNPNASPSSDTGVDATVEEAAPEPEKELTEEEMRKAITKQAYERLKKPAEAFKEQTPAQQAAEYAANLKTLQDQAGPSQYVEERANIKRMGEEGKRNLEQGKGLAALQAAAAMLQGNNAIRGLAAGASKFGETYGEMSRAAQAEQRALETMRINLADAERKEKMGLHRDAAAATAAAAKNRRDAHAFRQDADRARRTDLTAVLAATKPEKPEAGLKVPEQLGAAEKAYALDPTPTNLKILKAAQRTQAQAKSTFGTSDIGATKLGVETSKLEQGADIKYAEQAAKQRVRAQEAVDMDKATRKLPQEQKDAIVEQRVKKSMDALAATAAAIPRPGGPKAAATPAPATALAATKPDISSVTGAPAGSTIGELVAGLGHEVRDSSGKLLGYAQ